MVSKGNFLFWGLLFRFHVKFWGCTQMWWISFFLSEIHQIVASPPGLKEHIDGRQVHIQLQLYIYIISTIQGFASINIPTNSTQDSCWLLMSSQNWLSQPSQGVSASQKLTVSISAPLKKMAVYPQKDSPRCFLRAKNDGFREGKFQLK